MSVIGASLSEHMRYLAISGEDLSTYASSSLTYYPPAVCKSVYQQLAACSGSPHDDESSH